MSYFYKFDIIAQESLFSFSSIERGVSINDKGNVAFVVDGDLYVGNGNSNPIQYSSGSGTVNPGVQINNQDMVVTRQSFTGGGSNIAIWNASNPATAGGNIAIATGGVLGSEFSTVLSYPSITNLANTVNSPVRQSVVFSGIAQDGFGSLGTALGVPVNPNVTDGGFLTTPIQNPVYPVITDGGEVLVRLGNRDQGDSSVPVSPIALFNNALGSGPVPIANVVKGFVALGQKPGISEDGQIAVFYGDLQNDPKEPKTEYLKKLNDAQSKLKYADGSQLQLAELTAGPGIFASIKVTGTFVDLNTNGIQDRGEDRVIVRIAGKQDGFDSFTANSRISVNSTHRDEAFTDTNGNGIWDTGEGYTDSNKNGKFDPSQRAVTIVYKAVDLEGKEGIYTNRLNFFGTETAAFNPDQPRQFKVGKPSLVVEQGESIRNPGADGRLDTPDDVVLNGNVESLDIHDSVNNRNRGDVAFWVQTSTGDEAVIRSSPQKVVVLDFDPSPDFTDAAFNSFAKELFRGLGTNLNASWAGSLADVFSTAGRTDLSSGIGNIKQEIVQKVQDSFTFIGANVRVVSSDQAPPSTDGSVTRVFIGDSPFGKSKPLFKQFNRKTGEVEEGILNGTSSSVDLFDQDILQTIIDANGSGVIGDDGDKPSLELYGEDTVFVLADNIFRTVDKNDDGVPDLGSFTDVDKKNLVSLSDSRELSKDDVVTAIANITAHEIGHSLGLSHLDDTQGDLLMNKTVQSAINSPSFGDELRIPQRFSTSSVALAEYPGLEQNDQERLTFTVGNRDSEIKRQPPSKAELTNLKRANLSLSTSLDTNSNSITVARAFLGIVRGGEVDALPELIDLGSGQLEQLLSIKIPVEPEDQVIFGASTDGQGIDIFGVNGEFTKELDNIDLTNPLLVVTDNRIRGDFVNDDGEPVATSLNLFQRTSIGFVQIGKLGAAGGIATPTLSIANQSLSEVNGQATFTVTLSEASSETVTVNYTTGDGTASSGADYTPTSGQVTFAPGELAKTIDVPILDDGLDEPDETFSVTLSSPANAQLATAIATGTIADNDDPPITPVLPSLSINNVTVTEGNSGITNATFTVTLSAATSQPVTVGYTTSDGSAAASSDYTASSGTLTFTPGQTSLNVTVPVIGDGAVESNEAFFIDLSGATNATIATARGTGNITNDDVLTEGKTGVAPPPINFGGQAGLKLKGSKRADTLRGSRKNDVVNALNGNDKATSGAGNDRVNGGKGNDLLKGGAGNDLLNGEAGNDTVIGNAGNDILVGGAGIDKLTGGAGSDLFGFNSIAEGGDTITDFSSSGDLIDLRRIFANSAFAGTSPFARFEQFIQLVQTGANTEVKIDTDGNGSSTSLSTLAILKNVTVGAVSSQNFVIA